MDRSNKRRRYQYFAPHSKAADQLAVATYAPILERDYNNRDEEPSFSVLPLQASAFPTPAPTNTLRSAKRVHGNAFGDDMRLSPYYASEYPSFYPEIPMFKERVVQLEAPNPFIDDGQAVIVHPRLIQSLVSEPTPAQVEVNAFIKARFSFSSKNKKVPKPIEETMPLRMVSNAKQPIEIHPELLRLGSAPLLPPDFGGPAFPNNIDRSLFNFFMTGLCRGRTNVKSDNAYETEIAPMAVISPLVRHAILSLSATYILDFQTSPELQATAQQHYTSALKLLGCELKMLENYSPGKEEAVVAALMLLSHNEVINWEIDAHESSPKWYRSGKRAEYMLEKSDPAYKYHLSQNVQCSKARFALGQLFCLDNVMSDCLFPLDLEAEKCGFTWLLHGDEVQNRKIIGMTGLSPQLMHYFAKITFLSTRLFRNPSFGVSHMVAKDIEKKLVNFWQWSEITQTGYSSSDELLRTCNLDESGKVTTHAEVTNLIAECYVAAAQIYLQCRALRRPRHDFSVQMVLARLLKCIQWQPTSGDLFTAQTPLFAVFIAGTVAFEPEHRGVIREWFSPICEESRGNVKPALRAMELIWKWTDEAEQEHNGNSSVIETHVPLSEAPAWWEEMVERLSAEQGRLNLS